MRTSVLFLLLSFQICPSAHGQWAPVEGHILTKFAGDISAETPLPEYPRPQMVREAWLNLNGLWDYAVVPKDGNQVFVSDGQILVPFCIESALSGVKKIVSADEYLYYSRKFDVPDDWAEQRVLLHFGAVDWECIVYVNGENVGSHRGGYAPFTFDVTDAIVAGENALVVRVSDPTDTGYQPRGKQVNEPKGIWYTAVTGIWQTVWLEPVPKTGVEELRVDGTGGQVSLAATVANANENTTVRYEILDGDEKVATASGDAGEEVVISLDNVKRWSPDSPHLYDIQVDVVHEDAIVDTVTSYVGVRDIALAKDADGVNRLHLNGQPLFHFGPLDQGWWPDGLYTAPTDEALRYDIEMTKAMGFNMARKHVKVEPARWYYWCDKLGLMVWQDMPNGDGHISRRDDDLVRTEESADNYYHEWGEIIDAFRNHPSIVMWVPFNEGWGQFATGEVTEWTRKKDPTRLVNQASGWTDRDGGDVLDVHHYPGPGRMPKLEDERAVVLGEFGGLGLPLPGHTWQGENNWGYKGFETVEELRTAYAELMVKLLPHIEEGLAAAIYTQTTDVEIEVNGLMTYDRAVSKLGNDWLKKINEPIANSLGKE